MTDSYSVGLGTWRIREKADVMTALTAAVEAGYRLIDTAAAYCNEIAMGKILPGIGAKREDLFIQNKAWRTNYGFHEAQDACKKSLHKMKLDYFDAYLIHWPEDDELNAQTWAGLLELQREGLVRYVGVSNFKPHHIESLKRLTGVLPQINQIELHPGFIQEDTLTFCRNNGIRVQAHSPLGNGQILAEGVLAGIAQAHGKSTAQVCIRWALDKGADVIVKSLNPERIRANIDVFDFALTDDETERIDALPFCGGLGLDSDKETDFAKL